MADRGADLLLIERGLLAARAVFAELGARASMTEQKAGGEPVTVLDRAIDRLLHELLPQPGDGWLSEETADDLARLREDRVWVVDPLDGTREFIEGVPEWCVSIGLVERGEPVAGGVCNPATGEVFIGAMGHGVFRNGEPTALSRVATLSCASVLASRREWRKGEWAPFVGSCLRIRPMGSVAYKLALVGTGLADATWTLAPKREWDVAAGAAIVRAAGGFASEWPGRDRAFNRADTLLTGFVASNAALCGEIEALLTKSGISRCGAQCES